MKVTALIMDFERFRSDRRQLGGLLLVLGVCVAFQPLTGTVSLINANQDASRTVFDNLWVLFCGILQLILGTLAMAVGYLGLVHDYGNRRLTGTLLLMTQLLWIPFVTDIIKLGIAATPPYNIETIRSSNDDIGLPEEYIVNPFVTEDYSPNQNDVLFIGGMGILGLISYGIGFFGSLAFLEFALYTFDAGKPTHRDAKYYRGRLLFYSFVMLIAGMSQLLLGAYVIFEFGEGPLSPPIGVAMYRVSFPEITMAVGSIQMVVGYYGVGNYLHLFPVGPNDNNFQILALIGWLLQLTLQYIVQISYIEGEENSAVFSSLALYSFGMNIFPPFLDYKMRTTPISFNDDYYGVTNGDEKIGIDICADLESPETPTQPMSNENPSLPANLKTVERHSGSKDSLELDRENSDYKRGIFSRFFTSIRGNILDQSNQPENKLNQQKNESEDCLPDQGLNKSSEECRIDIQETRQNVGKTDINVKKNIENYDVTRDIDRSLTEHQNEYGIDMEENLEYSVQPRITEGKIVGYPDESGITIEETVEYPADARGSVMDTVDQLPDSRIPVEEYFEFPIEISRENVSNRRKMEDVGDDVKNDDQDTPPRSNQSFRTDMEDTWGDQARQQMLLSPIAEESSHRIPLEQTERDTEEEQKSSLSRGPVDLPRDFDGEDQVQNEKQIKSKTFVHASNTVIHPSITDSYYDYDTDDGFEISEATPDDDTAALDAKIDKLKGELVSDTNMESYLNQIL